MNCSYCQNVPADTGYDRCHDCRTWRDEEWCNAHNVDHGSGEARRLAEAAPADEAIYEYQFGVFVKAANEQAAWAKVASISAALDAVDVEGDSSVDGPWVRKTP